MRSLIIFFTLVLCCACSASAQEKPHKEGWEYYKEASALYREYIKLKNDSDKKIMAGKIIEALENSYYADTTNTFTIDYLVLRTYELEYYDSCIYWAKKGLSYADHERDKAFQSRMIGLSYVFKADLKSAIPFLNQTILYVETDTLGYKKYEYRLMPWQTVRELKKIAIGVVSGNSMPLRQTLLKKRVTPCRYAIQLLDYLRTVDPSTAKDAELIMLRKKCQ